MIDEASSEAQAFRLPAESAGEERAEARSPERVVADHADLVYSLARRLTRNEEEARDLFQESFVRILHGLPAFEGRSSLRTWICQIVINGDRNRRRWWRRLRRNLPSAPIGEPSHDADGAPAPEPADPAAGPERAALSREIRGRVESGLRGLPADQRLAVVLRDVEGLSYEEIAEAMGIALGTVKSKIARARAALRARLADLVEGP